MKVFLGGILGIALVFGLAMPLQAKENDFIGILSPLLLNSNVNLNAEYTPFADETETGNQGFSTGQRIGAGFLNIFLGLGSYIMGDWRGGLWLTFFDVVTIPLSVLAISIWVNNPEWAAFPEYFSTGEIGLDIVLLVPLWYGIVVIAWTLPYIGVVSYVVNFVYKFIRPFEYEKPGAKTARLNDLRNWYVGLMPDKNGRMGGQIAFTAHFW